jgi:transcriptional regulator with XRE-family HTH domain
MTPKKLKEIRRRLGMTQKTMADELGVTVTTVARWEIGERSIRPQIEEAIKDLERRMKAAL